jgi:Flp pilus assembly protein TadG
MRPRERQRCRRLRGTTVVETAMVLSVLLVGILAVFEYGRLVMLRQVMGNAVREGARLAIVGTASVPVTTTSQIIDTVNNSLAGQRIENLNIQVYQADPETGEYIGAWNLTPYGGAIAVRVDGDYAPMVATGLGIVTDSIHLSAVSMMRSEAN